MASVKTRIWKEKIENLLLKRNICGICLLEAQELDHLENQYHIETEKNEKTLEDLIVFTFGNNVKNLLATPYFCEKCVSTILESYLMLKKMRTNHLILHKYFNIITQQIKLSSESEEPTEKQLMLTIDNINSLNVPTTVIVGDKKPENKNMTQIFLCELDNLDASDTEFIKLDNSTTTILKYECPYCGKQFNSYESFKSHHIQHNEVFYRCHKCSKKFKLFEDLINHRICSHSDDLTTCSYCKIILLSPESKEHEVEHTLLCPDCQIIFDKQEYLDNHIIEHHSYVTCQHCLKTFSNAFKSQHHRCIFKCFECKDECIHETYLISYREQHMAQQTSFKCTDCDFKYTTRRELISHVNEEHLLHFPYLCDLCGDNFASRPSLTSHMYKKHSDDQILEDKFAMASESPVVSCVSEHAFECKFCHNCFNSKEAYELHIQRHLTEKKETQCQFCGEIFCNIRKLNIHVRNTHPGEVNSISVIYRCTMCPADFDLRSDFLKHEETHPKGTKHVCRVCNESFESKNNYFSHTRKHKIKYDKQCPICLKKYTKHTISRHMKQHSIEKHAELNNSKSIMCDICGALVTSEEVLIKHAEKHNEERQCPHCEKYVNSVLYEIHVNTHKQTEKTMKKCSQCDYTTRFSTCLEAHINRYHLNIRPYQCEICNKTFFSNYTLQGHKLTHKNERPEHYCLVCSKKFISKKALVLHTRLHTGETPYPCELCELSFLSASRRRQHMIRKHFEPSVECQICQKKLYTQSDLRRHIADCHDGEPKRKKKKSDVVLVEEVECQEIQEF